MIKGSIHAGEKWALMRGWSGEGAARDSTGPPGRREQVAGAWLLVVQLQRKLGPVLI